MRVKIKKTPYILDRGYAKFLVDYEELVFVESNFKRVLKVLKSLSSITTFICVVLFIFSSYFTNSKYLLCFNFFMIGMNFCQLLYSLKEEFKK
jgi:hypothetical protein